MGNIFRKSKAKEGRGKGQSTSPAPNSNSERGEEQQTSSAPDSKLEMLHGGEYDYIQEEKLGEGSFGEVFGAFQLPEYKKVAIKVTKGKTGRREAEILRLLSGADPERNSLPPLLDTFEKETSYCLVFNKFDISLSQYLVQRQHKPLQINEIRPIAQQLMVALKTLKSLGVVHADIKPDNVMLVDRNTQPLRVTLIDFGLAKRKSELEVFRDMQNIGFRAPEVLLGMPGDEAIDMWGLGCVIARLFIGGRNLFPVHCPYEYMRAIIQLLGQPSDEMLAASPRKYNFFDDVEPAPRDDAAHVSKFRFLTPEEFLLQNSIYTYQRASMYTKCASINDLPTVCRRPRSQTETQDISGLMSLLKRMLRVDRSKRITPEEGLRHRFITMSYLADKRKDPYVKAALDSMSVCRSVTGQELFATSQRTMGARTRLCLRRAASDILHMNTNKRSQTKASGSCISAICCRTSDPGSVDDNTKRHHPKGTQGTRRDHHGRGETSHHEARHLSDHSKSKKQQDGQSAGHLKAWSDEDEYITAASGRSSSLSGYTTMITDAIETSRHVVGEAPNVKNSQD